MTMIRTVAPTVLAVDLALARANLRVDGDYMDALITTWVQGITRKLEHDVGQRFMEQTWEVRLSRFPGVPCWMLGQPAPYQLTAEIGLPHPVLSVTSVSYIDAEGNTNTLETNKYRLNVGRYVSTLSPARGASWPATAEDQAAVIVTVKCGYGNAHDKTPETAQLFILGKLVEQYDPATRMERDTVQSAYLNGLVDDLRCYA